MTWVKTFPVLLLCLPEGAAIFGDYELQQTNGQQLVAKQLQQMPCAALFLETHVQGCYWLQKTFEKNCTSTTDMIREIIVAPSQWCRSTLDSETP